MAGVSYSDVTTELLDRIPEFKESVLYDPDELEFSYAVWGGFSSWITTYIRRLPLVQVDTDPLVIRVFDLANELLSSDDDDTQTIVCVELLENFYMHGRTLALGRRKLPPEHVTWLDRQGALLGTSDYYFEGEVVASNGLDKLADVFAQSSLDIEVKKSAIDGSLYLGEGEFSDDVDPGPTTGPRHVFCNDLGTNANINEALALLDQLSERLEANKVPHHIALYRVEGSQDILTTRFDFDWSDDQSYDT